MVKVRLLDGNDVSLPTGARVDGSSVGAFSSGGAFIVVKDESGKNTVGIFARENVAGAYIVEE